MTTQIKGMAISGTIQRIIEVYGKEVFDDILNELSEEDRKIMGGENITFHLVSVENIC
jgi:hypothetical protein